MREALELVIKGLRVLQDGPRGVARTPWKTFKARYSDKPFFDNLDLVRDIASAKELSADGNVANVWTAIVMLYAHYSHPKDQNLEGVFFRILEEVGHSAPADLKEAVFGLNDGEKLDLRAWKTARKTSSDIEDYPKHDGVETTRDKNGDVRYYSESRVEEADIVRKALLDPLLMNYRFGEKVSFKEVIKSDPFQLLMPIYDVWNGREGWGGLKAVFLIFLKESSSTEAAKSVIGNPEWEPHYQKMLNRCSAFANEITQAAMRRALARPIEPPYDLVRHFLLILVEVQDWEEAVVYYEGKPNYLFKRLTYEWRKEGKEEKYKGVREPWREYEIQKNGEDYEYEFPELPDDKSATRQDNVTRAVTPDTKSKSSGLDTNAGDLYMWWTAKDGERSQDLWSRTVLPGLSDDERAVVSGTSIRFKFPKACRIPLEDDEAARVFLVESYRRQQLELMRGLIPKVRARRAALRNAVSAIMGRNMSHNIGSHVLARYAAKIASEANRKTKETENSSNETGGSAETGKATQTGGQTDATADFLSYLQKRMDFLAELGTNDEALGAQPLSLKTHLERLNLTHEDERLGFSPLLNYIAGTASVKANVTVTAEGDRLFSCPGGEVGVHALFVILENVIRNSARHNSENDDTKSIEIEVKVDVPAKGFIRLQILDLQTRLRKDGTGRDAKVQVGDTWRYTSGRNLRERMDKAREDRETGRASGEPLVEQPEILPDKINYIIEHEEIIDQDGRLNPKYLGIREMQICAQYLRQLPLSDLEDVPWSDRDPDIAERPAIHAICEDQSHCLAYVIYLQEAKLLATIASGEDTSFEMKSGVAKVTLSPKALADDKEELARARVQDLPNFAFAAYQANGGVLEWTNRHAGRLPIRQLALPAKIGIDETSLTWEKVSSSSWWDKWPNNLTKIMEQLHQAYAGTLRPVDDHSYLTGLAVGCNACLKQANLLLVSNHLHEPINAFSTSTGHVLNDRWCNLVYCGPAGRNEFKACFWIDHIGTKTLADFHEYVEDNKDAFSMIAWEPCFSDSPCTTELLRLSPGEGWELIAAALPRVAVMDERVQAQRREEHRHIKLREYWEGMQVEVPWREDVSGNPICNLENPDLNRCTDWLRGLDAEVDFLVIHLTVLEKLQDKNGSAYAVLEKLLDDAKVKQDAPIVVVTGRGTATFARSDRARLSNDLGKRIRHLPVSAILEYLVSRPSKLGLMRVLWSASQLGGQVR
jgi:hypothetical protein